MLIRDIFTDKALKPKMKTNKLAGSLASCSISAAELLEFAKNSKEPVKATCLEAMETVTKDDPKIAGKDWLSFAGEHLGAKAPRVKWESARLIGNIAKELQEIPQDIINNLLANTLHDGTVVRWSAAYALGEIYRLNTPLNKSLRREFDKITASNEKVSIKKIYLKAIKDSEKNSAK